MVKMIAKKCIVSVLDILLQILECINYSETCLVVLSPKHETFLKGFPKGTSRGEMPGKRRIP